MLNSLYIGLSQQVALRNQMDGIANNVANMNTTGFKREEVLFREFLIPAEDGTKYSYVMDFGISRDMADGAMTATGNSFDFAIKGEGFFAVETTNGNRYTRNGHFSLNDEGTLVTAAGDPLLDESGRQLTFVPEDGRITIAPDGRVSAEFANLGALRLSLVTFDNLKALKKIGNGLYQTAQPPIEAEGTSIHQGMLENSNVHSVVEMTRMIEVTRKYQLVQRLIDAGYDLERTAIQRLGKVQ